MPFYVRFVWLGPSLSAELFRRSEALSSGKSSWQEKSQVKSLPKERCGRWGESFLWQSGMGGGESHTKLTRSGKRCVKMLAERPQPYKADIKWRIETNADAACSVQHPRLPGAMRAVRVCRASRCGAAVRPRACPGCGGSRSRFQGRPCCRVRACSPPRGR